MGFWWEIIQGGSLQKQYFYQNKDCSDLLPSQYLTFSSTLCCTHSCMLGTHELLPLPFPLQAQCQAQIFLPTRPVFADHPQYCLMKIWMKIDLQHILHVKNLRLSYPGANKPHITRYGFNSMKQLGVFLLPLSPPNRLPVHCRVVAGMILKRKMIIME